MGYIRAAGIVLGWDSGFGVIVWATSGASVTQGLLGLYSWSIRVDLVTLGLREASSDYARVTGCDGL